MNLNDALYQIAEYVHLNAPDLQAYAAEDSAGGRNAGYDGWSIDADEGKVLYALVRALKPAQSLEIGVRMGASTAHLLAAIDKNGSGALNSYDIEANGSEKRAHWTFHQGDALTADFPPAEFVFEDSNHGLEYSLKLFERLKTFAHVVVTHDYAMTTAHGDFHVKEAFDTVFPDGIAITLDGCERGLAVWVNSRWKVEPVVMPPSPDVLEAMQNPPKPIAKPRALRKPATPKAKTPAKRTAKK